MGVFENRVDDLQVGDINLKDHALATSA
jgi:hypothetical protein